MEIATPEEVQSFLNTTPDPAAPLSSGFDDDSDIASPDEASKWIADIERREKYGTAGQQIISGLEGAASAATFGLSTGLETALGVPAEDIAARREENPFAHGAGQVAGLVGTAFVPGGAGRVIEQAGAQAARLLGLAGASTASKVGAQATKMAVENMLVQSGDEVSKMFADSAPPTDAAQTALLNIGLSGLIGGAAGGVFGAASPLWKSTAGPRVERILNGLKDKADGLAAKMPDDLAVAIQESGMEITPEVQAFLSGTPLATHVGQTLEQAATGSGLKFQQGLKSLNEQTAEKAVESLGKTTAGIERLRNLSDFETGANVVDRLHTSIKSKAEPVIEEFQRIRNQFSKVPLTNEADVLADKLANLAESQYGSYRLGDDYKFIQKQMENLPNIRDLEGLRQVQSGLWNEAKSGKASWDAVGKVVGLMREVEGDTLLRAAGDIGADEIMRVQLARSAYGDLANELTELNKYLKLKKFKGPESFLKALSEAGEENILRKVTREDSVRMVQFLNNKFPEAAQDIRDYQVNSLLKDAARQAKGDEVISVKKLFRDIDDMSPEMRENLIGPDQMKSLENLRLIKESLPDRPMNTSGTAKTMDALWGKIPASATTMASMLMGNNPVLSVVVGGLTGALGRDIPDATRLALLKYIGQGGKIEAGAFKTMVDYMANAMRGEIVLNKTVKNVFKSGAEVLSTKMIPDQKDRERLDKRALQLSQNTDELLELGGNSGAYIPAQASGVSATAMNVINYINQSRPSNPKMSPLDKEMPLTDFQKSKYDRILDIAEQPLILLKDVKSGTITAEDVKSLNAMYPDLYSKMRSKATSDMNDAISKDETIPYNTRMGLSVFLGQALDSTMTPQSITSIQQKSTFMQPMAQQNKPSKTMSGLDKLANQEKTMSQARVFRKLKD